MAAASVASERVLVVEDETATRLGLTELIRTWGFTTESAGDGEEALSILAARPFDLVLSDVVMPKMDGYELYLEVHARHPNTPVLMMTAFHYDKDHIIKRSKMAGLEDVLYKKPIDPPRLREIIKRHVGRPARA